MAVDDKLSEVNPPPSDLPTRHPPFVEVKCTNSGKTMRFAALTDSNFAVSVINRKLENGPPTWHIEAAKDGEEPIVFGPNSVLVEYGDGWRLQTVPEPEGFRKKCEPVVRSRPVTPLIEPNIPSPEKPTISEPNISFFYIAKLLLAFVLIFAMGTTLTLALENLPKLILYINSSM